MCVCVCVCVCLCVCLNPNHEPLNPKRETPTGVYSSDICEDAAETVNHAVLAVGYGIEEVTKTVNPPHTHSPPTPPSLSVYQSVQGNTHWAIKNLHHVVQCWGFDWLPQFLIVLYSFCTALGNNTCWTIEKS